MDPGGGVMHAQRGVALVVVLVIVAVATVLASDRLVRQQHLIGAAQLQRFTDQAYFHALAAEEWARVLLEADFDPGNRVDSLDEAWALELPPMAVEGGLLSARLSDLQGRLNLNNLVVGGRPGPRHSAPLRRLFAAQGVGDGVLEALGDWMDPDREPNGFLGAEDDYYSRQRPAYLPPNRPLADPSELRQVRGVTDADYRALRDTVTALPGVTPVNVNTASQPILEAIGFSADQAVRIIEARATQPFQSVQAVWTRLNLPAADVDSAGLTVSSQYFLLDVAVAVGDVVYRQAAVLHRDAGGTCRVYRRARLPQDIPTFGD